MSRRQIVIDIEPHEDGKQCYGCVHIGLNGSQWWCGLFKDYVGFYAKEAKRPEFCILAEQRHKRMVEALRDAEKQMTCSTYEFSEVIERIRAILREEEGK